MGKEKRHVKKQFFVMELGSQNIRILFFMKLRIKNIIVIIAQFLSRENNNNKYTRIVNNNKNRKCV